MTRKLKDILADLHQHGDTDEARLCDCGHRFMRHQDATSKHSGMCAVIAHKTRCAELQMEYNLAYRKSGLGRLRRFAEWFSKPRFSLSDIVMCAGIASAVMNKSWGFAAFMSALTLFVWWTEWQVRKIKSSS